MLRGWDRVTYNFDEIVSWISLEDFRGEKEITFDQTGSCKDPSSKLITMPSTSGKCFIIEVIPYFKITDTKPLDLFSRTTTMSLMKTCCI